MLHPQAPLWRIVCVCVRRTTIVHAIYLPIGSRRSIGAPETVSTLPPLDSFVCGCCCRSNGSTSTTAASAVASCSSATWPSSPASPAVLAAAWLVTIFFSLYRRCATGSFAMCGCSISDEQNVDDFCDQIENGKR